MPRPTYGVRFDGSDYIPSIDDPRLTTQLARIWVCMNAAYQRRAWLTLDEISDRCRRSGEPTPSVSAQLRHLRKPRFGEFVVIKRPRGDRAGGLWEYQVWPPGSLMAWLPPEAQIDGSKPKKAKKPKKPKKPKVSVTQDAQAGDQKN